MRRWHLQSSLRPLALERLAVACFGSTIAFLCLLCRRPRKSRVEFLLHDRQFVGYSLILHSDTSVGCRLLQGLTIVGDGLLRFLLLSSP